MDKFPFGVGDVIEDPDEPIIRIQITAIGRDSFLAIDGWNEEDKYDLDGDAWVLKQKAIINDQN